MGRRNLLIKYLNKFGEGPPWWGYLESERNKLLREALKTGVPIKPLEIEEGWLA